MLSGEGVREVDSPTERHGATDMNSADVRSQLVSALALDLIGPEAGHPNEREALTQAPSRWYLTGSLVPYEAQADEKEDETSTEEIDVGAPSGDDDEQPPERASARRAFLPSSIGISVLVPSAARELTVAVSWG